jgi:transcriptional regulator with XRE-family HTH domain
MVNEASLYKALGERIRILRLPGDGIRMTQAKLAEEVGLERTSITNIEKGNQKVPLHVLYRICEALQVNLADVLPPISDVASSDDVVLEDVSFGGFDERVPPLVKRKLLELLVTGEGNASRQD